MASRSAPVVCVGSATCDTIAVVESMPREDDRVEASEILTAGGGPAATAAVALARLGIPVEFAGVVGRDPEGAMVLDGLEREGVGTRLVERRAGVQTGRSLVVVSSDTASRAIITRPAPPPVSIPGGFDWVHVDQSGFSAVQCLEGRRGPRLSVDDGNMVESLRLDRVDLYVPTVGVLARRFGTCDVGMAIEAAVTAGAKHVVATGGANGAYLSTARGICHVPSARVQVRSTLGAGDVFHGALLAGIALGQQLERATRFANVCAALSTRALDGRSAVPGLEEALTFLAEMDEECSPASGPT